MSTASRWVESVLHDTFEGLAIADYNCRPIRGTSIYSQHSWPNALDIAFSEYGYSPDPEHQRMLDEVAEFIWEHREELSIKLMLWRGKSWVTGNPVAGHQDHIHIDFWPTGVPRPPCAGGSLRYQFSNGRIVYGDPGPENGISEELDPRPTPPPDDEGNYQMPTLQLWAGYKSKGQGHLRVSVRALQIMLAHHGHADAKSADATCAADGWFGNGTDASVRAFQRSRGLVVDGIVGRLTWDALNA